MKVNAAGADWLILKTEITKRIDEAMTGLLADAPENYTYKRRGEIAALRGIIQFVEDADPPQIEDANYVD